MAIVARQALFLVVVSMLVSSQAIAQVPFLKTSGPVSEDPASDDPVPEVPPGTFSDDVPPLDEETPPSKVVPLDEELRNEARALEPETIDLGPDEEYVFDGNYWNVISSGEWLNSGLWYTQADMVMLNRSVAQRLQLTTNAALFNGQFFNLSLALETDWATFGYEPGTRLTLGKFLGRDEKNRDHSIEFSFFGMNEWSTGLTAVAASNEFLMGNIDEDAPGFNFSDEQGFSYTSNLNSYEMNVRRRSRLGKDRMIHTPDGVWQRESNEGRLTSIFAGLRLISIDEEMLYYANGGSVLNINTERFGTNHVKATNDLFGFQLGLEWYEQTYNWSYGLRGKAGAFVNFADQQSVIEVVDTFNAPDQRITIGAANDEQLSLMLELSILATYQIRSNMALRFSYDFLYLQGLAHAPEQLSFNTQDQTRINTGGFTLFDGASFGFEVIW